MPDCLIRITCRVAGLVPPAVAVHIMGKGGAALILIMLFMAVTSTGSAEQIAVSSLYAYDVYATYINKKATGKQVCTTDSCCNANMSALPLSAAAAFWTAVNAHGPPPAIELAARQGVCVAFDPQCGFHTLQ